MCTKVFIPLGAALLGKKVRGGGEGGENRVVFKGGRVKGAKMGRDKEKSEGVVGGERGSSRGENNNGNR